MACQGINAWFNANEGINLLDCNIECCSGDNCNNHNLTLYNLTTTAAPMNSNATGAGTSESPTTVANGNNISKRCIQLIAQLILLSVELVQLRGQANPCDRNYTIS